MGFPLSALELAYHATHSCDLNVLLERILSHEKEIYMNNTNESNETHRANQTIQKVVELDFPKTLAGIAQRKTKSNYVQTLIEWILTHDLLSKEHRSISITVKKHEENMENDNPFLKDLLKLGFNTNDIENCFIALNINTTKKFNLKSKETECIDRLINNSKKTMMDYL